ncbi:lantibiotic dehydratase [Sphingobacterium sp. UBA6320]|jgi:thiopeptide-type bacteriocin biosynthesis protein|uniref:lantibiotic dehydratase n=1 Tax=Sphingobacterium sp. UBA6320 TaxID=1947510 RepID=UPI0025D897CD|nr:lantibiotic dehydratase [Sphingobacterium sp. UBA6320]
MSEFQDFDFYLLRSPKISLEKTQLLLDIRTKQQFDLSIKMLYSSQYMKHALFLSSEQIYEEVEKWLHGENPLSEKLAKTLYKYTVRLGSRCTPYGHFAGISMGKILDSTNTSINIIRTQVDHVQYRLDMQYLAQLIQHIATDDQIRFKLKYSINSTLYRQGNYYKYYQQQVGIQNNSHFLNQIRITPILAYIVTEISNKITYNDLLSLIKTKGATDVQSKRLLNSLIQHQILISEMQPQITGKDCLSELIKNLKAIDIDKHYHPILKKINNVLKSDCSILVKDQKIKTLTAQKIPSHPVKNLVQGDLLLGTETNALSKKCIKNVLKQLEELLPLSKNYPNIELEKFKNNFSKRYEGQMISLLEALDPDSGIGYGNSTANSLGDDSILKNIASPKKENRQNASNAFENLIFRKYVDKIQMGQPYYEITLQESDINNFNSKVDDKLSSPTFYAMGNLLIENNTNKNILFNLHACGGSSASNLISRFGYLDTELEKKLIALSKFEQDCYPDAIVAEIVHLPENRTGNILQRPSVRDTEIILMTSENKKTNLIKINDLHLFMQNKRLILWSEQLRKEIIPKLTTAHNFQKGINLYRFLADLQFQDPPIGLKWEWGNIAKQSFLPRIRYKDIILNRASWHISKLTHVPACPMEKKQKLKMLMKMYCLPKQVVLIEGDSEMLLDFSNPIAVDIFFDKVLQEDLVLCEFLFSEYQSPVKDVNGNSYNNEIILPIKGTLKQNRIAEPPPSSIYERNFVLGTEWVYVKIYCGIHYSEELLKTTVPEIIKKLKEAKLIKKWFFIRYRDPEYHLRLRFEAVSPDKFGIIVQMINENFAPSLDERSIFNIQFDTYKREIERYTPEYMLITEDLFHHESEYVLSIIKNAPNSSERWNTCLACMNKLLDTAGLTLLEKCKFSMQISSAFSTEFGNNKFTEKGFNEIFREQKKTIEHCINKLSWHTNEEYPISYFKTIVDKIEVDEKSVKAILNKKSNLLSSYIHMLINRLLPSEQRLYEYALYHILNNYYRMCMGKTKSLQLNSIVKTS